MSLTAIPGGHVYMYVCIYICKYMCIFVRVRVRVCIGGWRVGGGLAGIEQGRKVMFSAMLPEFLSKRAHTYLYRFAADIRTQICLVF